MAKVLGTLQVKVLEANGLATKDADSVVYVKLKFAGKKYRFRLPESSSSDETIPEFAFDTTSLDQELRIELISSRKGGRRPLFLGMCKLTAQEIANQGEIDSWFHLHQRSRKSKVMGKVHMMLSYQPVKNKDMIVEVLEAKDIDLKTPTNIYALVRFGDHEMRTKSLPSPAPKWKEAIKFIFDDSISKIKVYVKNDRGDKIAVLEIPTVELSSEDSKGKWYPLKSKKSKSMNAQIKLKITIGRVEVKRQANALDLEPIEDLDTSDYSEIEASDSVEVSDDGPFKRRKKRDSFAGSLFNVIKPTDQGKIVVNDLQVKILDNGTGAIQRKSQWILGVYFERQSLTTDPMVGMKLKFPENISFELTHFTSVLKVKLYEGAEERPDKHVASFKMPLTELENTNVLKGLYDMKIKKKNFPCSVQLGMTVKFVPYVVYTEDELSPEVLPERLQNAPVIGKVSFTLVKASGLAAKDSHGTSDPYAVVECHGQTYRTKVIERCLNPEWNETFTFKVKTLKSRVVVVIWDKDIGKDDFLGAVVIDLSPLEEKSQLEAWVTLGKRSTRSNVTGELLYRLSYAPAVQNDKVSPKSSTASISLTEDDESEGSSRQSQSRSSKRRSMRRTRDDEDEDDLASSASSSSSSARPKKRQSQTLISPFSKQTEVDDNIPHDLIFKVILLGDSGVGKTGIFTRFVRGEFDEFTRSTIGIDFATKSYRVDGCVVKVQISDTAGQERYQAITRQYYRGAMGAIIIYDITSRRSFENVEKWISEAIEHSKVPNMALLLVGNKVDQEKFREVPQHAAIARAKEHDMLYIETSAREDTNIQKAFQLVLQSIYDCARTRGVIKLSDNPYAVTAMPEDVDIVKIDPATNKTIILSEPKPQTAQQESPAANTCAC